MNKIIITGRLTHDPEVKQTTNGVAVVNITVAVDRPYSKNQEKVTDFITVVAWHQTADFIGKYFSKGKPIAVVGSLQSRKWQDRNGNNNTAWEVQAESVEFVIGSENNNSTNNKKTVFEMVEPDDGKPLAQLQDAPDEDLPF